MKDIRLALKAILTADVSISAIVTAGSVTRIYPGVLPQGITLPSVVYTLVTESSSYHMDGSSNFPQDRYQIDCWGLTADAAVSLSNLVHDRLSGFRGTVAYGSVSPQEEIIIEGVFHDQGRDDYDAVAKLHTRRRDYLIWYRSVG